MTDRFSEGGQKLPIDFRRLSKLAHRLFEGGQNWPVDIRRWSKIADRLFEGGQKLADRLSEGCQIGR